MRVALRENRFVPKRANCELLIGQLDGLIRTTTLQRLSKAEHGLYLDVLLVGAGARGRAADIYRALRVVDGSVGAAKVYYAEPAGGSARCREMAAGELAVSLLLDETAAAPSAPADAVRARVVRYSDSFDLGCGRTALFMPLYVCSLHGLVHESRVSVPLPATFLVRMVTDVLRGLVLLHAAGFAHCDVKADNILFDGASAATLIDLGAATRIGGTTRGRAQVACARARRDSRLRQRGPCVPCVNALVGGTVRGRRARGHVG